MFIPRTAMCIWKYKVAYLNCCKIQPWLSVTHMLDWLSALVMLFHILSSVSGCALFLYVEAMNINFLPTSRKFTEENASRPGSAQRSRHLASDDNATPSPHHEQWDGPIHTKNPDLVLRHRVFFTIAASFHAPLGNSLLLHNILQQHPFSAAKRQSLTDRHRSG